MAIELKTPLDIPRYAPKSAGMGLVFSQSVERCKHQYLLGIGVNIKEGKKDRIGEVRRLNKAFDDARESIAQDLLRYLVKHDGAVDAWPNPDTGARIGFKIQDDESSSYETYYYKFDYFGSDYESDQYGLISGGKRIYRNPYQYKDTERMQRIKIREHNLMADFKDNNPFKFGWCLLVGFMILLCFAGPVLSTGYLFFLQRAADPETVELAVEAFAGNFTWIMAALGKAPAPVTFILNILLFVPAALVMLMKLIPEMICAIAGKSVIVLIIYGLMLFIGGFMAFGMIYSFLGERIPSANPIEGMRSLISYMQSKCSRERKEAHEENERLREEYTALMEDFHREWYSHVLKH